MTLVRQLSIALTDDGEVGDGTGLLFTSRRDFKNFVAYTNNTAMVMGFNTAQELTENKVSPTEQRPWVVISRDRFLKDSQSANVFYVDNLPAALEVASDIAGVNAQLKGWTIIGGIQVFEAVIESLAKNLHLTSYYMCRISADSSRSTSVGAFHKLSKNAAELEVLLRRNMIDAQTRAVVADVVLHDSMKEPLRASCAFKVVTDKGVFDETGIDSRGPVLVIDTTTHGRVHIPFNSISHFIEEKDRLALTIFTTRNTSHTIRLESGAPGLAFLKQALTTIISE